MLAPRPLPEGGLSFTHHPSVAALNVPATAFLSSRPLIRGAATGALVFSRATGQDRVLLIQRAAHDSMPLRWEVPGGACDLEDETMLHGLARELWEEAGLRMRSVVRQVGKEQPFLTRRGLAVSKVTFEVEVETSGSGDGGSGTEKELLPEVVLDPNEHAQSVGAMASPAGSFDGDESLFDSAQPFKGVVVCCTNVPTEQRADIEAKTTELGGVHKYDLTPDCTHLIVGDYDTPKYRHVAKERPDVRAMTAGWVEAVRNLWVQDAVIDFVALEKEWQLRPFETGGGDPSDDGSEPPRRTLLCCMTGFEDPDERQQIIDKIQANGGRYTGDLTKRVTHLVVYKPEGRKYQAAIAWGVVTVSAEWVYDSVERGLILNEKLYDPVLPREQRGLGAWNKQKTRVSSLGKRLRDNRAAQDEGKRKLRKTTSMKLNSQRDNLWGDILGKPQASEPPPTAVAQQVPTRLSGLPPTHTTQPTQPSAAKSLETQGSKLSSFGAHDDSAIFASCCFYILINIVASLGGLICHSIDEVVSASGAQLAHRFLIVPQTSAPESHPRLPDNRCMHKKYFFDPSQHVIGRPFPFFPIPGFEQLCICTAGFTGVDLNQYDERFTPNISLLVCPSLTVVRKQKLELALAWKVPVVSADWLWECISTGFNAPIKRFLFPEMRQNLDRPKALQGPPSNKGDIDPDLLPKPTAKSRHHQMQEPTLRRKEPPAPENNSNATAATHFDTAPTHVFPTDAATTSFANVSFANISFGNKTLPSGAPLSEASSNNLNKTPTTPRKPGPPTPRKPMSRIMSEVADSEATDGDFGHPEDLPLPEDQENAESREPSPANREADQKRLQAEKAAAEHLALSTKIATSLLDAATAAATSGPAAATAPLPPGSDSNPAEAEDTCASTIPKLKRRKRNILGRAISNVSAGSSTSNGDSSVTTTTATTTTTTTTAAATTAAAPAPPAIEFPDVPPPALTQLEYEDPEARRYKEDLMNRMMGTAGDRTRGAAAAAERQERLTLAEMGGYEVGVGQQQQPYGAREGRRTSRRR
ncbi:hypothetical protein C8A05DRAFT_41586 [Staphylotrichum tortipilum]|uniref:Uncharacterized protein n=1 Tax=Staphylotrichum tortipilum TaxID=2831512 RepID=A0AAN6MT41_9PEZI|nr:hypothetical protein C8A05DRAFT_41586 [Staphylotrichum longicolle]